MYRVTICVTGRFRSLLTIACRHASEFETRLLFSSAQVESIRVGLFAPTRCRSLCSLSPTLLSVPASHLRTAVSPLSSPLVWSAPGPSSPGLCRRVSSSALFLVSMPAPLAPHPHALCHDCPIPILTRAARPLRLFALFCCPGWSLVCLRFAAWAHDHSFGLPRPLCFRAASAASLPLPRTSQTILNFGWRLVRWPGRQRAQRARPLVVPAPTGHYPQSLRSPPMRVLLPFFTPRRSTVDASYQRYPFGSTPTFVGKISSPPASRVLYPILPTIGPPLPRFSHDNTPRIYSEPIPLSSSILYVALQLLTISHFPKAVAAAFDWPLLTVTRCYAMRLWVIDTGAVPSPLWRGPPAAIPAVSPALAAPFPPPPASVVWICTL